MKRSGRRRRSGSAVGAALGQGASAVGVAIARNPMAVGGATAFLVVFSFVSANALWYQPFAHPGPLLKTRFVVERPAVAMPPPAPRPQPRASAAETSGEVTASVPRPAMRDPEVEKVQSVLAGLKLYSGTVDGLTGPMTRKAIEDYQRLVGLAVDGRITPELMRQLDGPRTAEAASPIPAAAPRGERDNGTETNADDRAPGMPQAEIVKIQAGLRAFGNEGIELDGVVGERTRKAIREFQSLFRLPATGEPDPTLLAKMSEIGLIE